MINYNITNYIAKNLEYRICVFLATFYLKVGKIGSILNKGYQGPSRMRQVSVVKGGNTGVETEPKLWNSG